MFKQIGKSAMFNTIFQGLMVTIALTLVQYLLGIHSLLAASGIALVVYIVLGIFLVVSFSRKMRKIDIKTIDTGEIKKYVWLLGAIMSIPVGIVASVVAIKSMILAAACTAVLTFVLSRVSRSTIDLSDNKFALFGVIALVVIIVMFIGNVFIGSSLLSILLSAAIVIVFMFFIVHDSQSLDIRLESAYSELEAINLGTMAAFDMLLNIINIFIHLASLFDMD